MAGMVFDLTQEQVDKYEEWCEAIKGKVLAEQARRGIVAPAGMDDEPYYGASGGGVKFVFIPTGIGVVVKAIEHYTGEEIDLTDYDCW